MIFFIIGTDFFDFAACVTKERGFLSEFGEKPNCKVQISSLFLLHFLDQKKGSIFLDTFFFSVAVLIALYNWKCSNSVSFNEMILFESLLATFETEEKNGERLKYMFLVLLPHLAQV
jgi:hypothetical protein